METVPDHFIEIARDAAAALTGVVAHQVEADPADNVVLRVRSSADDLVVDGKKEDGADPRAQCVMQRVVVPLRPRVAVELADLEVTVVALQHPVRETPAARSALASVEVQQAEGARRAVSAQRTRGAFRV